MGPSHLRARVGCVARLSCVPEVVACAHPCGIPKTSLCRSILDWISLLFSRRVLYWVIMPPSALDRLASLQIDYPMLFELRNDAVERVSHCGVLEFVAEEGMIYMPYWVGPYFSCMICIPGVISS
ncbi:uncharacterized protein LOC111005442 [Momordica charantia]|uniref:Uncharacterized protein LOC111005442 n=1 Tax=Momordica charantia TaxID=3673 RepID=A0A6J1BSZ8_MOMCH|nr:uncharacterized protein LOC111005442 [Momordica charantia]